jgi:Flp pilus assembly protein TadG
MRMRSELRTGSSWFSRDDGATAVTVAILSVVLIGLAAMVIDVGSLYTEHARLSIAADAAALAGAHELPNTAAARTGAAAYAAANAPEAPVVTIVFYDGEVAVTADASAPESQSTVRPAVWRPEGAVPAEPGTPGPGAALVPVCHTPPVEDLNVADTIKITVTKPSAPLYFAKLWSKSATPVSASATARVRTPALRGVMPIGVSAYSGSDPDFGLTVGQVMNLTASTAPGHYGWMTLNDPPIVDPDDGDKWQLDEFEDVVRTNGTTYPVYLSKYPGVTGAKSSYETALKAWYARTDKIAIMPVVDSWGNGSQTVTVIGFARWQLTQEPFNKHIYAKYLGAVSRNDMELSAFWPYSSIQEYSLIK